MIINPESFGFRNSRIFVDLVTGIIHFLIDTATAPLELRAPLKPLSGSGERLSGAKVFFSIPLFSLQPFTSSRFFFSFFFCRHIQSHVHSLYVFFFSFTSILIVQIMHNTFHWGETMLSICYCLPFLYENGV